MSIYMIAISDLGEVLTTLGYAARVMSLNIILYDKISSTWVAEMGLDELLPKYGTLRIFKNDLDWRKQRTRLSLLLMFSRFFRYFSMTMRSLALATLLVVRVIPFQEGQIQSIEISDLVFNSCLFIMLICISAN